MKLAIEGHEKRGAEVIEILKMLGGTNPHNYSADSDSFCFYIGKGINDTNVIYYDWIHKCYDDEEWIIFTLEEFLEKFPYKVGDKVYNIIHNKNLTITDLAWNSQENEIVYQTNNNEWVFVNYIQPYKEETMAEQKKDYEEWFLTDYLEFENNDGTWADEVEVNLGKNYEIQIRGDKTFIVKKKPQYPKTYEECCKIMQVARPIIWFDYNDVSSISKEGDEYERYIENTLCAFRKLLICRNAYWRMAGEQRGLGKPWQPDYHEKSYEQGSPIKYVIYYTGTHITKEQKCTPSYILAFPTEEMRDAFFENFKDLIEECKELL